jgi:lysozyme family protein
MADGKKAIGKVLIAEGFIIGRSVGYNNDGADYGKETIGGISRKFWPNWEGWDIVDVAKKTPGFPESLVNNQGLYDLIIDFYDINFWTQIGGDGIKSEIIAEMLVKAAVHEGVVPGISRAESIVHLPETGKASEILKTKLNLLP